MQFNILKKTKQRIFNKEIYGFDIETYDDNKKFLCCSLYGKDCCWFFTDKRKFIDFLKQRSFNGCVIAATNLSFDFNGVFYKEKESRQFKILYRGSDMIYAKTYIKDSEFTAKPYMRGLQFIDTMNYARLSVEELGNILGIPKLKDSVKDFIGRFPKNDYEWRKISEYNMNDARISREIISFFYKSFEELGATAKMTIASTAMSLFRNRYLENDVFRHPENVLIDQFNGYYGGNTHAYSRGRIEKHYYYDFNSLYPFCMLNALPDPNSLRYSRKNDHSTIFSFEGMSHVTVSCPYMEYPVLPYKSNNKLFMPYGIFSGWFCHNELRYAVSIGYKILKVHKSYYYKKDCYALREYALDMYRKRAELKASGSSMQLVAKLLMNSLYGKFGQKFIGKENIMHSSLFTIDTIKDNDFYERIGDYIRIKRSQRPANYCIPIWASYITAYARIELHKKILITVPAYVDTDSLITTRRLPHSDELGKLKLEHEIDFGVIVKPKFYYINDGKNDIVKIKGLPMRLDKGMFEEFLKNPKLSYKKFVKFKEALRRHMIPNEIIDFSKEMRLEDDKRVWNNTFDPGKLEFSYAPSVERITEEKHALHDINI